MSRSENFVSVRNSPEHVVVTLAETLISQADEVISPWTVQVGCGLYYLINIETG
jgi:hypothetical protein